MAKRFKASTYFAKNPQPVILHFQPHEVEVYTTPADLQQWEKMVKDRVGLHVSAVAGNTYTGTTKTENGIRYFDDCDE